MKKETKKSGREIKKERKGREKDRQRYTGIKDETERQKERDHDKNRK
jgi:hypothetical protein